MPKPYKITIYYTNGQVEVKETRNYYEAKLIGKRFARMIGKIVSHVNYPA